MPSVLQQDKSFRMRRRYFVIPQLRLKTKIQVAVWTRTRRRCEAFDVERHCAASMGKRVLIAYCIDVDACAGW